MTTSINDYDVAAISPRERASIRSELTHEWDMLTQHGHQVSNTVAKQFVVTAIKGIDAIDRIEELANKMAESGPIASAAADMIREALKGA